MVQEPSIGRCRRMMEFIDDDVIERIGRKSLQMLDAPKRLDRRK